MKTYLLSRCCLFLNVPQDGRSAIWQNYRVARHWLGGGRLNNLGLPGRTSGRARLLFLTKAACLFALRAPSASSLLPFLLPGEERPLVQADDRLRAMHSKWSSYTTELITYLGGRAYPHRSMATTSQDGHASSRTHVVSQAELRVSTSIVRENPLAC